MVKSPSCWIDPFQKKLDKRRTTKLTRTAEPMVKGPDHRPALIKSTQNHRRLHILHLAYHRRPQWNCLKLVVDRVENRVQRMQAIRACVAATVRRRKGNFPLASIPVADIPRSYSFYSPVMSDDSGRNSREETTGSTGDKKSTPLSESGTTGCGAERKIPQQETLADSDTSDHRSRLPTGGWTMRISDCPHPIEQRAFREKANLEWMTCLSCGARWSRKTGQDDIQVKMGLIIDQPQMTPPCPGCASTTRLQQMTDKTEMFFGCSRFHLCKRVVHTSLTSESRVSPSAHLFSAAHSMAVQAMVLDSDSVGSEESFTMLNVPAEPAVTQQAQHFLLEQLRHISSSGM